MTSKHIILFASILFYFVTVQIHANDEDDKSAAAAHAKVFQKLREIIIESIDLNNVTPREALKVLSDESIKGDPDHRGISFIGHFTQEDSATRITVRLNHVSLKEALKKMFPYSVAGSVVDVKYDHGDEDFTTRTFFLPNGLYLLGSIAPGDKPKESYDVLKLIANKGVRFAPGATAIYRPDEYKLTVVATSEEINDVDELLNR